MSVKALSSSTVNSNVNFFMASKCFQYSNFSRIRQIYASSSSAQPGNDIAQRRTPFYVYLKPFGANDADIKARSKMSGTPPVFIPMPPH